MFAWLMLSACAAAQTGQPAVSRPAGRAEIEEKEAEQPLATSSPDAQSEVPSVPGFSNLRGINAGASFTGVHDSSVGWSTLFIPVIGYSFNDVFSIDATVPIYLFRLGETRSTRPKPGHELVPLRGELADLTLSLHAQFLPRFADYQVTASMGLPSGDENYGLTSGRVTFDISNHFERTFQRFTPTVEMGGGDTTSLVNRLVTKNYTSLGPLAHFQAGLGIALPFRLSFEADAYEQLPIGDQKIYTSTTRRNVTTTVVVGHNVSEDNGFTNSLDLPFGRGMTLSAYYNRSLRLHSDTTSLSITFVLRDPDRRQKVSTDDLFR